ncbi:MAG: NAD-binding protein, partial [Nitrososphaerota archaeon]|nr:NAD-binding protein [Nitrososphaerota archaeon]
TDGTFEPSFYLKNMRKDLYLLVQSSQEHGVFLPTLGSLFETYIAGLSMDLGDQDYSAIYRYLLSVNKLD